VVVARCFRFSGDRAQVRDRTVKAALQMLRHRILEVETSLLWELES
jgi:nicotinamide mononucleotide (NMN) deamidase PncC